MRYTRREDAKKEITTMDIKQLAGKRCDMCGQGVYIIKEVQEPITNHGKTIMVAVTVAECSVCHEHAYDADGSRKIQAAYNHLAATA